MNDKIIARDSEGRIMTLRLCFAKTALKKRLSRYVIDEAEELIERHAEKGRKTVFLKDIALELGVKPLVIRNVMRQLEERDGIVTLIKSTEHELWEREYKIEKERVHNAYC